MKMKGLQKAALSLGALAMLFTSCEKEDVNENLDAVTNDIELEEALWLSVGLEPHEMLKSLLLRIDKEKGRRRRPQSPIMMILYLLNQEYLLKGWYRKMTTTNSNEPF